VFECKIFLKKSSEAIDIQVEMVYSPYSREEVNDGSILHEVSHQEGNEESQSHHNEKWQTRDSGNLPDLRYQNVPHRQKLKLNIQLRKRLKGWTVKTVIQPLRILLTQLAKSFEKSGGMDSGSVAGMTGFLRLTGNCFALFLLMFAQELGETFFRVGDGD
jgi:hypothetical protein